MRNRNKLLPFIIGGLVLLIVIAFVFLKITHKPIAFTNNLETTLNKDFNYKKYIASVEGNKNEVTCDSSKLNTKKVGTYPVIYKYKGKEYEVKIKVVDINKPVIKTKNISIEKNAKFDASELLAYVKDESKTKTTFKEKYDFSKMGKHNVEIVVTDESGNKTTGKAVVTITKEDKEKPTFGTINDIKVRPNSNVDYKTDIVVKDNCDPNPKLIIDDKKLNLKKEGVYKIKYTALDRSGNKNTATRTITVDKNAMIGTYQQSDQKIVYLTFDDGPSHNTAKVLDILKQYGIKATFFVTGLNPKMNYLIKRAHDEGHTIGIHTYSHDYSDVYASYERYMADFNKISTMLKDLIGYVPHYVRLPGGASNTVSRRYCPGIMTKITSELLKNGYQYYDWNVSSGDASGNNVPVPKIIAESTNSKQNNINLLMHDTDAKNTTIQALPKIIEHYRSQGYIFKAIDDSSFVPHQHVNN